MKFPIAFRVFGVINLIGFLLLSLQTAIFFDNPQIGFWPVVLGGATALWFLITAFVWMFASNKSYPFLYLTVVIMAAMSVSVIMGFLDIIKSAGKDLVIVIVVYGTIGLVYSLFMVITLFFKPVKDWLADVPESRKRFDPMVLGIFFAIFLVSWISFRTLGNANKRILVIDEVYLYNSPDSARFGVNLNYMAEFDRISIASDNANPPDMLRVVVLYADKYETVTASDYIRIDTVTIQRDENGYVFDFEPIRARRLVFYDLNPNRKPLSIRSVTVSRTVDYYDLEVDNSQFVFRDGIEPPIPEGYDGDEYDASEYYPEQSYSEAITLDDEEPIAFSADDQRNLIEQFLNVVNLHYNHDTQYDFNQDVTRVTIDGRNFGYYQQFRSLFSKYLGEALHNFITSKYKEPEVELSINQGIRYISGVNLYDPSGYEGGSELPFGRLNPAFLTWASDNLVFANDEPLFDETINLQYIYDGTFKRTLWMLAASYEYLGSGDNLDYECDLYWDAMQEEGFDGVSYLHGKYGSLDSSTTFFGKYYEQFPSGSGEYYYFNEPEAIGFWMRRKLDGSHKEVFLLLQKMLESYDNYVWG